MDIFKFMNKVGEEMGKLEDEVIQEYVSSIVKTIQDLYRKDPKNKNITLKIEKDKGVFTVYFKAPGTTKVKLVFEIEKYPTVALYLTEIAHILTLTYIQECCDLKEKDQEKVKSLDELIDIWSEVYDMPNPSEVETMTEETIKEEPLEES